jgi:cytochrome c5
MRERIARLLALATLIMALLLAFAFAVTQERRTAERDAATPSVTAAIDTARRAQGREVLEREGCMRCHALEGRGNPRLSLDGIGARRDRAAIRDWIVAEGEAAGHLSAGLRETKQRYRDLPADDMEALLDLLAASRD